jgi:hypothetical protein
VGIQGFLSFFRERKRLAASENEVLTGIFELVGSKRRTFRGSGKIK